VRDRGAALTLDHVTAIGADVAVIQLDLGSLALHDTILADAPTAVAGPGSVLSDFTFFWTALGGGPVWDGIVNPAGEQILPVDPWFRAYPGRDAASCDSIDLRLSSRSEARGYGDPSYTNADGTLADVGGTSGPWTRTAMRPT
jgi:hypothetical protein